MYDQDTEQAMTAVQVVGDAQIERWFNAICAAYANGNSDWNSVKDELEATASQFDASFDSALVESFVTAVERLGDPLRTIADMERIGVVDLASNYPALLAQAGAGADAGASEVESLSWVTDAQRVKMERAVGGIWPEFVRAALDSKYPVWRSAGASDLVTFLDGWGDHIIAEHVPPAPPPPAEVESLSWVTEAQRVKMERAVGGTWPEFVRAALDSKYPVWRSAGASDLVTFLDGWGDHIIAEHVPPAPPPPAIAQQDDETTKWVAFLQKNIGRYKGESSWTFYRGWLLAEARGQGFEAEATAFVAHAETLKAKADAFTELGIELHSAPLTADEISHQPVVEAGQVGQVSNERLASFQALADDPAVEGIDREVLDQLLEDPEFDQRMTEAEALVDAALADAVSETESS
ncbi:MAG TPA: hypothetical protein VFG33_22360 [Kribbella sp.]|uniref:hypothetical protein n=1 Tax=Kribbella sp. TaxID=1871183 RepID=UPI002D7A3925|nr:hypothetical protein [Kribbella sp.]HET6296143.1 hypothetical protein [Kribbella sp.]